MPLTSPRVLTAAQQAVLADFYGDARFGPIVSQARRLGGSTMVAVPGRTGFEIVVDRDDLPKDGDSVDDGIGYGAIQQGGYLHGNTSCNTWETDFATCDPTTMPTYVNFLQLVPDFVKREKIAGQVYVPVDGLIWGSALESDDTNWGTFGNVMGANMTRWAKRIAAEHRHE